MTPKGQMQHLADFQAEMEEVLISKGGDYATEDKLSNFKEVAAITKQSPARVVLTMIATKVSRLSNLIDKEGEPNNESVSDSTLDIANYAVLLDAVIRESEYEEKPAKKISKSRKR